MADVLLPPLGDTVDEARVTGWLKQIGDVVAIDEPLITVETDKVETEIPSLVAGVLIEHRATEGDTVPVGAVLGVVQAEAAASMPDDAATVEDGLVLGAAPVGPPASSPDPVDVGTTSARPAAPIAMFLALRDRYLRRVSLRPSAPAAYSQRLILPLIQPRQERPLPHILRKYRERTLPCPLQRHHSLLRRRHMSRCRASTRRHHHRSAKLPDG